MLMMFDSPLAVVMLHINTTTQSRMVWYGILEFNIPLDTV